MGIKLTNNAFATLAAGINSSVTSITLTSGQGARFPTLTASDYFYATLIDTSNNLEIVKCTARSTDVLTVVRAQETTTARAYSTGDRIEIRLTAATFVDAVNEIGPTQVSDEANSSTGYFDLPSGTTAQRPGSPAEGMFRHNTDTDNIEFYDGGAWKQPNLSYLVEYLVIAGGGGGGFYHAAAGGAGGYRTNVTGATSGGGASAEAPLSVVAGTVSTVTVGAGGSGATSWNTPVTQNGSNSVFGTITSIGGGGGAHYDTYRTGASGGSGGAAFYSNAGSGTVGVGSGTSGQGYAGGDAPIVTGYHGGGGGGAGGVGGSASANVGGNGGAGVSSSINGTAATRAGGGGGHGNTTGGTGTAGGGNGAGGSGNGTAGSANTGGGGGGGGGSGGLGGAGGSGLVIVRYLGSQRGTGGTVTSSGGYTIHTFTSSGTFTA